MKKFALLLALLALFAVGCSTDTTIESGSVEIADAGQGNTDSGSEAAATDLVEASETAPDETLTTDGGDVEEPPADAADEPNTEPAEDAELAVAADSVQAVLDADDWCQAARAVEDSSDALDGVDFLDPDAVEDAITQTLAVMTAAQRVVPDEIAGDVETSVAGFAEVAAALELVNWSFLDLDLSVIEILDGPMSLANYNIELYGFNECDIGTDPGPPPVILEDGTIDDGDDLTDDGFEFEGTVRDQAVQGLVEAGFTADEASCILADLDLSNPAALSDPTVMFTVFADCGIPLERLAEIGG